MAPKQQNKKRVAEEPLPGAMKSQCRHFFKRCASGEMKKASDEEITQAKEALATYDSLQCEDQTAFAKAFFSNKGSKQFGFVKDYTEKFSAAKKVTQSIQENYFTRIAVLNV